MTIKEWIENNVKDGVNVAEGMEMIEKDAISAIKTKEQVLALMDRKSGNPAFIAAGDSVVSTAVQAHDSKFETEKLPGLIQAEREKLMKELNPDETPEQKELRELREKVNAQEAERINLKNQDDLLAYGKELYGDQSFDPLRVKKYSVYGDQAKEMLKQDKEANEALVSARVEAMKKELYGNNPPPANNRPAAEKTMQVADFDRLAPADQMKFIEDGGVPVE